MKPRLARMLTRLYPQAWRERYGAEFEVLLEDVGLFTSANVLWSALWEHILPTKGLPMNHDPGSRSSQSWCRRAPWAVFGLGPLVLLAAAYLIACLYLWIGWSLFLPGADTPFGIRPAGPIYGLENVYFQAGKYYYFCLPMLVAWGLGLTAARHRIKALWPLAAFALIACIGASIRIYASRTEVPHGLGHISLSFGVGTSVTSTLLHAVVIFSLSTLPWTLWILWRLQRARYASLTSRRINQ